MRGPMRRAADPYTIGANEAPSPRPRPARGPESRGALARCSLSPLSSRITLSRSLITTALWFALCMAPIVTGTAGAHTGGDGSPLMDALRYRDDAIGLRLTAVAAVSARGSARAEALGIAPLDALARELGGARFEAEFPGDGDGEFWIAHLPPGADARSAAVRFEALAEVESAWPIAIMPAAAIPNDSLWSVAYYFRQPSRLDSHAPEAWDVTTGDTSIVVAIVDTGVYTDHPDLAGQIWTNWAEQNGTPGVDDDQNGFVDDDHGWDFIDLNPGADVRPGEDGYAEDNDPNDFAGHGTAVAGLVGARTNNGIGVAGTAWKVRMIPLRVGWSSVAHPSGEGDVSYMARAVRYATRMGAHVINVSFTTTNQPDLIFAADAAIAAGVTIVAASGNFEVTHYLAQREDVISVTGTGPDDKVLGYATVGPSVDIAAAGSRLATITLDRDTLGNRWPDYTTGASGTSFSAPLVSGAVALMQADRRAHGLPLLTPFEARLRLMDTADDIGPLNSGAAGFGTGRLNLLRALTDPPESRKAETRARLTGPAVALPGPNGARLLAVATTAWRVMILDAVTGATIRSIALPAVPIGGLSAATLGNGAGIGLFVVADTQIFAYDLDLEPLPGWPVPVPVSTASRTREVVLADLNGDEVVEALWCGGHDGRVYSFSIDGRPFKPPLVMESQNSEVNIAVSDLDGVPGLEIAATVNNALKVRRPDGSMLPNWPDRGNDGDQPPLIARLAPNELPSVVTGYQTLTAITNGVVRWRFPDNESPPAGTPSQAAIATDLDGDGAAEIIQLRSPPMLIAVLGSSGDPLPGWQSPVLTQNFDDPPVAGPVGAGGRMGILLSDPTLGLRAFDTRGGDLRVFPKPGKGGLKPMIGDIDGDGRTEVVAGSYTSEDLMFYDSGPGSWSGRSGYWVTARANHARTGSLVYAPPLMVSALAPPLANSDLSVIRADENGIELRWTTPSSPSGDPPTRFEIRHSTAPIDPDHFFGMDVILGLPPPGAPGSVVTVSMSGLAESATHYFALRTRGASGNWSGLSNVVSATLPSIPPDRIADFHTTARSDTTLMLAWTATGGNHSTGRPLVYRVRAAEAPLTEETFDSAPHAWELPALVDAGGHESRNLSAVPPGRHLWFAMIAVDSAGNRSPISNLFDVTTTPYLPSAITDLAGFAELGSTMRLRWTAAGEDGAVGRPASYWFRASETPLDEAGFESAALRWEVPAQADGGRAEATVLQGLQHRRYWIGAKTRDRSGNLSPLSNVVSIAIADPPGAIDDLASPSHTDSTLRLEWTAPSAPGSSRPAFYQVRGRGPSDPALSSSTFDAARFHWNVIATAAAGRREAIVVSGLPVDVQYNFAVAAVDSNGNRGPISNVPFVMFSTTAPGLIGALRMISRNDTTVTIQWTATGDDGRVGRPLAYFFRASGERVTAENFESAPLAWRIAATVDAGGIEAATFQGFVPNQRYYLAAMAIDRVGNLSFITTNLEFTLVQSPPAPIGDLSVEASGDTSTTLVWTATGEDLRVGRPRSYLLRASEDSITYRTFDSCPLAWDLTPRVDAGGREDAVITGLEHGRRYWFAIVAADRNGNRSTVPASLRVTPGPVPPAPPSGLSVAAESDTGVTIAWIASGEDLDRGRPARYSVRAAEVPLDEGRFENAPFQWEFAATVDAGGIEHATLAGFLPDRRHWVSIVAHDRFGNRSPISEPFEVTMQRYVPAPIADLGVVAQEESGIVLRWTASGEDGASGRPRSYVIRAARAPLDSAGFEAAPYEFEAEATVDAGGEERITMRGLEPNHRYWAGAVAIDSVDNRSRVSNVVSFWLGRLAGRDGNTLEVESRPSRVPVRFLWRTKAGAPRDATIRVYDLAGRLQTEIPLGDDEGGLAIWDGRDRDGNAVPPAIYFARLVIGGAVSRARVVLVR
jgi:subtilisin family serine protease/chitodextrinase